MAILPPSTLGMLGGGQLGRLFVMTARTMGYEVIVLDPDPSSPAGAIASKHLATSYSDRTSLDYLREHCRAVTTEFENVPAESLDYLEKSIPLHPSANALRMAQNRQVEKQFIVDLGLKIATFIPINHQQDVDHASQFSYPARLKIASSGYDGKGQIVCHGHRDLPAAWAQVGSQPCVLEQQLQLDKELSVIVCRDQSGEIHYFPVAENVHVQGILATTVAPARVSAEIVSTVKLAAATIANALDYCGVLAVEFFVTTGGDILVNEIAPRPHNSGHYTLDACYSSQFEQQLRMMCDLPAGSCTQHSEVVMWNIMGDLWRADRSPAWQHLLALENVKLHLYGKHEARPGRKMGHVNCLGESPEQTDALVLTVKQLLTPTH